METLAPTKRGNPSFGKRQTEKRALPKKGFYEFKLTQDFLAQKPKDKLSGEVLDNPYPSIYIAPNAGVAFNKERGEQEAWRFLHGYNSIWEKDQESPKPTKQRLMNVDGKNDIIFTQGYIKIKANEEAKFDALMVQDICEDNENKLNDVPVKYRLIDESKAMLAVRQKADDDYLAEKTAREASLEEMLPIAMVFGIDVSNVDEQEDNIRTQFILKSKTNSSTFLSVFNDPRNKIKYLVTKALSKGVIILDEGILKFKDTDVAISPVDPQSDIPEQISALAMSGDSKAKKLYDALKNMNL